MGRPDSGGLRAQREALAQRLVDGLAAQAPLAELQQLQALMTLLDSTIGADPRGRPLRRHLIALLIVAAVVSLAAWLPMPRVTFALELDAAAMQMQMQRPGTLGPQRLGGEIRAEGFDRLESGDPAWPRRARAGGASPLGLKAEGMDLRRVRFPAGATLGFEADPQTVRLTLDGAPHSAMLELSGATSASLAGAPRETANYAVAEWIELIAMAAPSTLWLARQPGHAYFWRGLQPASLRVVERQADADGQVRVGSSLRRAVLRLPATGRDLALGPGSGIELDGLRVEQAELTLGDQASLKLSGSAQRFVVTTGGFEQSLKPSVLDYAAHNHSLELVWSAAGLLWGVSTWLRKAVGDGA